jgi:hypothetical protein
MGGMIRFGVIGSGWRSECFLRTASFLGGAMQVSGIVSRSEEKRLALSSRWGIPAFASAREMRLAVPMDFFLVSVGGGAMKDVVEGLFPLGLPILCETPPAGSLEDLVRINESARASGTRVQVAEQYWLHPMNSARLAAIARGLLGKPSYAHVSVNHSYHNMSLIRKYLGLGFENAEIRASSSSAEAIGGPGRSGDPEAERLLSREHDIGILDFSGRRALFDFEADQHRSWIRSSRTLIRGERGEIDGERIVRLKDYLTPVEGLLRRVETGGEDDFEGMHLKGVMLGEDWLFKNPTAPARLSDEEIAQARTIMGMKDFIVTGRDFYPLAEASQDAYLALCLKEAAVTGKPVLTVSQPWSRPIS